MGEPFSIRIRVRGYELDSLGHLNQAVYMQYGECARWELLHAAGVTQADLLAAGVGPVVLKATIRHKRELGLGDEVDISSGFEGGNGRFLQLTQRFRLPDGTAVAVLDATVGLIDLETRRLLPDPARRLSALAETPDVLGLPITT